ncbi:HpcH/HpaI aldolase/citrate lyase family protein [Melissospora conviva]|uniref:HpcH/HpaI aldolase/citrate lyase family protein n=1 Tax=Melissospora conviva TaxID=3388432 RepID=UPI003C2A020A
MLPRSYLYVPGDAQEKLDKALGRGADALIVDLEDAVPPAGKDAARAAVAAWLAQQPAAGEQPVELWVRVNPGALGHTDVRAVVGPALTGVMVAKTESQAELTALDAVLTEAEAAAGIAAGSTGVVPLLESAAAVLRAEEIAAGPRVVRLQVGEADLAADTGITPGEDERELASIRTRTVLVSAAARINPPVAPVSTNFRDLAKLRASTEALARQGYIGRACIHPAQIAVANEVFTPDAAAVTAARELVAIFDAAMAAGRGVAVGADGRMIDEAVVRKARRVLALAR